MKVYDVTVFTKILTKEQVKHAVDLFLGHCGVSDDDITTCSQSYEVRILADKEIDMRGHAISIASYVQTFDPKAFVRVRDSRFKDIGHGIRWVNDGITAYSDSSVYTDPYYKMYIGDRSDYEIIDVDIYAKKLSERDKERFEGLKFVWRCTACWDMHLKAETIDDAIEEFEEIYRDKLWSSVVNEQESLRRATDKFREFDEYRRMK